MGWSPSLPGYTRGGLHDAWSLANFQAVFGNLTGEVARPTLWRGRPRPRLHARCHAISGLAWG